jgi:hypothetical protein
MRGVCRRAREVAGLVVERRGTVPVADGGAVEATGLVVGRCRIAVRDRRTGKAAVAILE